VSHSAQTISGQVLLNGQPSTNFNVLLWRNAKSDFELSASEKLIDIALQSDGFFTISPETKNFTVILVPSDETLKKPLILYDFDNEKLITKIVLSEIPQIEYNIKFENQNNAISQFGISSFINVNRESLLFGSTYVLDPMGIKIPIAATASLPAIWTQEAVAINEKISRLQDYAQRNSAVLSELKFVNDFARSLSLVSITTQLLCISFVQLDPKDPLQEDIEGLGQIFLEISYRILERNRAFTDRIMSLVSVVNSQINQELKSAEDSKKQQQIVWEKPTFTAISLSRELLSLRLSSTSRLKVEIGSYTQEVCSLVGNKISLNSIGDCSLYVLQGGNFEFLPAPPFKINFLVQAPAVKQSTITCVKGKLTKKVTAVKPKCPSGYKLKK
jgi:hypothetical protein